MSSSSSSSSAGNAFILRSDCPDVPVIAKITGTLVPACSSSGIIADPPGIVIEIPPFVFPLPKPPSADFGCYPITAQARKTGSPGQANVQVLYPNSARLGNCVPLIDFTYNFDIGCPTLSGEEMPLFRSKPGFARIEIEKGNSSSSDACEFKIIPIVSIPCPEFSPGSETVEVGETDEGLVELDIIPKEDPDACSFLTDIYIELPQYPSGQTEGTQDTKPSCCEEFDIVTDITSLTLEEEPNRHYQLNYDYVTIRLPQTTVVIGEGAAATTSITCESPNFKVIDAISDSGEDCCHNYTLEANEYVVVFPAITLSSTDGTDSVFLPSCTVKTVKEVTFNGNSCSPTLTVVYQEVSLGGGDSTEIVVCSVFMSSSSLVVHMKSLTFKCGLFTGATACGP